MPPPGRDVAFIVFFLITKDFSDLEYFQVGREIFQKNFITRINKNR